MYLVRDCGELLFVVGGLGLGGFVAWWFDLVALWFGGGLVVVLFLLFIMQTAFGAAYDRNIAKHMIKYLAYALCF